MTQRAIPIGDRHLAAALSTAYEAGEGPLTLSVAPRARPAFRPASFEEPRTASATATSRTAISSIQNAFRRQVLPSTALAVPFSRGSPPPVPRLCRLVPGSRRVFTTPRLSPGVARPSLLGVVHLGMRWPSAACRLLQPTHDPRARPSNRPNPAHRASGRPGAKLHRLVPFRDRSGGRVALRREPVESSRARGRARSASALRFGSSRGDRSP